MAQPSLPNRRKSTPDRNHPFARPMPPTFQGSLVAVPTPFRDGALDLESFREIVNLHAAAGTSAIVVSGTTGECATLTEDERRTLLRAAIEFADERLPVIAGVGTNCTRTTVELARFAAASGAAGLLVVTPYYNRPSRRGLLNHFTAVAQAAPIPIILYNIPRRTGSDLTPDIVAELCARQRNIVAIKEASGDLERAAELLRTGHISVLCGEDAQIRAFMALGADGAVNVTGNILPDEIAELVECARPQEAGRPCANTRAEHLEESLAPLVRDLFIETNPVPLKSAMARLERCTDEVRAPLAPLEAKNVAAIEETMAAVVQGMLQSCANTRPNQTL
ncbi:MAG: 4-hydroxy-tetrahydrodipicolinate synthase [Planctomycetes bacterium]|nr:4-hydroxy-tetrahydrodipicolinate synthase [Planctomycetota bacterium]